MVASKYQTAWSCGVLLVVISLGQALFKAPFLRIIELDLCRVYYRQRLPDLVYSDEDLTEDVCKLHPIQKDLAMINAYNTAVSSIIGETMSPYCSCLVTQSGKLTQERNHDSIPVCIPLRAIQSASDPGCQCRWCSHGAHVQHMHL
jgi:hypothetical protein